MKHESYGRYLVTTKDVCFLTGWSEPKARKFIRKAKEELGLSKSDVFTTYHLSIKLKVPYEELERRLRYR